MPKIENLDRLGSIAFILGNKELPSEISKEDYYNYKSVFSNEVLNSTDSLIDTKISKDDEALSQLQKNDSGISDKIKNKQQRNIEDELKKELSEGSDKEKLLKPEDILSTLSENKKVEVPEEDKKAKIKKESRAEKKEREKVQKEEQSKKEQEIKEEPNINKEKKELDDLDALLGSLDDILNEDIFEDNNVPVEEIKEEDNKIPDITESMQKEIEDEEAPIEEVVDEQSGDETDHIEAAIDELDDNVPEEDKNNISDDTPKQKEEIEPPKNELEDENLLDDDKSIDDIINDIEAPKAINDNYENAEDTDNIDDLDSILEEFNSVKNEEKSLDELLDREIEAMNKADDASLDDMSKIDDIDALLEEFNNITKEPQDDISDDELKQEEVKNKADDEDENKPLAEDLEDDTYDVPTLDDIENEVDDIIEKETSSEKQNENIKEESKDDGNSEEEKIEESDNNLESSTDDEDKDDEDEKDKAGVLPPPDAVLGNSKYGNIARKYNNDKILETIKKLPEGIQFSVLDAILNEKLPNKDMDNLLSLLEKNASVKKISDILTGNAISPQAIADSTKKAIELIPVPNSLKEYAATIRYAAIFIVALLAVSILSYQFIYKPLRSNSYFATGLRAVENGDYDTGELNFNRGDKLKPGQIGWYNEYANSYMDKDRYDDAYNKINMSLKVAPDDFDSKMLLGDYHRRRGENDINATLYDDGERLYNDMLKYESNKKRKTALLDKKGLLMMSRASTLNDKTYLKKAYDNYQAMLQVDGDTPAVRKRMMQIRIQQDDYEQVKLLRNYIEALKKGYFDDDVYPILARYLLYKDDFHGARTIYEQVLKKYKDNLPAIVGYAEYEARLKHYDKAKDILVNAAMPLYEERKITKGKEFVYNLLGQIYYNLTQYGNATREFLNALNINPVYPDANYNLGNIYFYQENNYQKAKMYYENAYSNAPRELLDNKLIYNLSWIQYLDKEYDKAFEGFLTLFNKESDNVVVSYALANSLMHLDRDVLARGFYNNALNHVVEKRSKLGNLAMRTEKEYALLNYMASLYNNLGVSYAYTYTRERKVADEQDAFKNFVLASQYFDQIRTSNVELQRTEKRTINLGSQNIAIPTYNIMTMQQKRRNLNDNLAIDDYIPKIMNSIK